MAEVSKDKIFEFLEDMIDALTIRRAALLAILATMSILLTAAFENRTALFALVYKSAAPTTAVTWTLGEESKSQLTSLVANNGIVGMVVITDVDLRKNRRSTKFFYIEDPVFRLNASAQISKLLPTAIFDFDAKNTEQMVAMLNNEFKCVPTADTINARFFSEHVKDYPVTCRIAVPPFFGELAGYMTVLLRKGPSEQEYDSLKLELNRLAIEIYLRDIVKKSS